MRFLLILLLCGSLFAKSVSSEGEYPNFCEQAAKDERVFATFKRHPTYQWVLEHVTKQQGQEYLNYVLEHYPQLVSQFDQFRENDRVGSPETYAYGVYGHFSPTTLRYIKVAGDLQKRFGDLSEMHIVEIGAGYGGQCKILADLCGFASYTIIDLPQCNALSKKYLKLMGIENVRFLAPSKMGKAKKADLVISNYAYSEIAANEQEKYLKKVITKAPRGYMTLNFVSSDSLTLEATIGALFASCGKGVVEQECPLTSKNSVLLCWEPKVKRVALHKSSPPKYKKQMSAITYTLSGGRLGDNLLSYFHALWIAYKHQLPFLYKSFAYFDRLKLDQVGETMSRKGFRTKVKFESEENLEKIRANTLIQVPYFPWTEEPEGRLPLFELDWEDPTFLKLIKKSCAPKEKLDLIQLPKDRTTIALHIRRGGSFSFDNLRGLKERFPLKFLPLSYYQKQLQRLATIFANKPLYVHIFTDDENPQSLVKEIQHQIQHADIQFGYRESNNRYDNNVLEDFFMIPQFDCLIYSSSNFSHVASKLGNYQFSIFPRGLSRENEKVVIDNVEIRFSK